MSRSIVSQVAQILDVDDKEVGRRLGVSVGTIKRWKKEPPTYARFALAALATGANPKKIFKESMPGPERPQLPHRGIE